MGLEEFIIIAKLSDAKTPPKISPIKSPKPGVSTKFNL